MVFVSLFKEVSSPDTWVLDLLRGKRDDVDSRNFN